MLRAQLERECGISGVTAIVGSRFLLSLGLRSSDLYSPQADDMTPLSPVGGADPNLQVLLERAEGFLSSVRPAATPQLEHWKTDLIDQVNDLLCAGKAGVRTGLGSKKAQEFADRLDAVRQPESDYSGS